MVKTKIFSGTYDKTKSSSSAFDSVWKGCLSQCTIQSLGKIEHKIRGTHQEDIGQEFCEGCITL